MGKVKTYVGSDGKLHFTDASGADSVLPFSSGAKTVTLDLIMTGYTENRVSSIDVSGYKTAEVAYTVDILGGTYGIATAAKVNGKSMGTTDGATGNITIDCNSLSTLAFDHGKSGSAGTTASTKCVVTLNT